MLTSIEFNNQFSFKAGKIENVIREWTLSSEFAGFELPATKMLPEPMLDIGGCIAKLALQLGIADFLIRLTLHVHFHVICEQHHPHPTLPLKVRA